jgi:hypothetical protein
MNIKMVSSKEPEYAGKIKKPLVVISVPDLKLYRTVEVEKKNNPVHEQGRDQSTFEVIALGDYLKNSVQQEFAKRGIRADVLTISAIGIDDYIADELVPQYEPTEVVVIRTGKRTLSPGYSGYAFRYVSFEVMTIVNEFDIELLDTGLNKKVWHARTEIVSSDYNSRSVGQKSIQEVRALDADGMVKKLFMNLKTDGLFE